MDLDNLNWQQPLAWEDCEPRLWLRDNLASFDEMSEYVFETEEFKHTRQKVDEAISSAHYDNRGYIDCGSSFADWLWNVGGSYIQDFDAQDVLAWAIKDELGRFGFAVMEDGYPVKIVRI